jgi:hypothetical protein
MIRWLNFPVTCVTNFFSYMYVFSDVVAHCACDVLKVPSYQI